ncbi:MAG TPA: hypothetical protein VHF22_15225 [Planctomycetota bacterium]|nr:hypothetical protein [Planctomycetota bacterium]
MTGRLTQALLAGVALATAVLWLAGCGGEPTFAERSAGEVRQALEQAGLEVCAERAVPAEDVVENAVGELAFVVAFRCDGDEDERAVVNLVAWPDQDARDEAIRRFEAASRPSSQNAGVQLAFGQFTIDVAGSRDEDVTGRALEALAGLGAA